MSAKHVVDLWVCQGRMCTANGSDATCETARAVADARGDDRLRVLRGGCYGLCDFGPNVVVRRYARASSRPEVDADRLSLTRRKNETVYSGVKEEALEEIVEAHLERDEAAEPLTYEAKDRARDEDNATSSNIRALRRRFPS